MGRNTLIAFLLTAMIPGTLFVSCATETTRETTRDARSEEPRSWSGDPVVWTRFGAVEGYEDADATWVWKAIPYAAPPTGELRWRAPQDPAPWTGVRRSRRFNGGCTQFNPIFKRTIRGTEDCLYLNVWRPQSAETDLPVYVWIHGGGNSIGSSTFVKDYYGNRVASRSKMVFVSMNYRLGPMGWFTNPALRQGASAEDASGNYGTLDIIKALNWVQENIAAFGGDPESVTIAGESAGGMNVLSLLISPPAEGLFQRAICESGVPISSAVEEGDAKSLEILTALVVADGKAKNEKEALNLVSRWNGEQTRDYLRSKSSREILRAYSETVAGMIDNPAIFRDGYVLPREGYDTFDSGTYPNKVPLVIGSNKEEVKLFLLLSSMKWRSELYAAAARYGSMRWRARGVDEIAVKLAALPDQPPVYAYRFDWGAPDTDGLSVLPGNWGMRLGAFHSLEVPFFLGTDTVNGALNLLLYTSSNKPGRLALSADIMEYLSSFARTGDPNRLATDLPTWEPWTNQAGGPKTFVLDARGQTSEFRTLTEKMTLESVMDLLRSELTEPLRSETLIYLRDSWLP